ncbi:MAG TPA: SiaC family regulatory phosphoprotein, partial [Flavobacteriales bacterium]|nr:SiaC family regulatory phosphoprotein [Flavobacteriales bacterium]
RLEYFNTSSSKSILDLFKILEELEHSGKKVKINWFHIEEDESMEEAGEEYKILLQLPFEILAVESL